MESRHLPRLHVVTDDRVLASPAFLATAKGVIEAGGGRLALQLRGPTTSGRRLYELGVALRRASRRWGGALLVNDRVDVALAVEADGVQLGERSFAPGQARRLWPPPRWLGSSVHDPLEASRREGEGADFLVVGTIYATDSHPGRPGSGPEGLARVGDATTVPMLAIGGVTADRVPQVLEEGAYGVAVLGAVWGAAKPFAAVDRLVEALYSEERNP